LRGKPVHRDRIEEWAARLEAHVNELELLAARAVADAVEPAFEGSPFGAAAPSAAAGPAGPARKLLAATEAPSRATPRPAATTTEIEPQARRGATTPCVAVKRGTPAVTLTAAIRLLRAGRLSASELIEDHLKRTRQGEALNAFIAVFEEQARCEAMAADRALACRSAGLLAGIPVAVKDLMEIRGYAMTGGSRALGEAASSCDADVVARLRSAGAVIVGAANLHELAYGVTSENPHFGAVKNPRHLRHMAGGSSGGSAAAVAAEMVLGAVGTDTGGSIRIPAAACGVVGLKPTYGRVTRRGVLPLSWSLDHVGPLAATCADVALIWAAMADGTLDEERAFAQAHVERDLSQRVGGMLSPELEATVHLALMMAGNEDGSTNQADLVGNIRDALSGLRVGRPPDEWLHPLHPDVAGAWRLALDRLGDAGVPVSVVEPPPLPFIRAAQFVVLHAEAAAFHRERLLLRAGDLGPDVRVRLEIGEFLMAVDYLQGQRLRRQVATDFLSLFDTVDVLLLPALPVAAPALGTRLLPIGEKAESVQMALTRYTTAFNQSGLPALVVPVGADALGLPLAVQVAGRPFAELDILRAGVGLEALSRLS
jgi:aspartyl-tRNA(Asn)/glutamyl-tRNA(Gln) amidotransferase subunit A